MTTCSRFHPRAVGLSLALIGVFGAAACGSDDGKSSPGSEAAEAPVNASSDDTGDDGGTAGSAESSAPTAASSGDVPELDEAREAVLDYVLTESANVGFDLRPDCVAELIQQLSPEDIAILYPYTTDPSQTTPDVTLSEDGEAVGEMIQQCTNKTQDQALVDRAVEFMLEGDDGEQLDAECLRKNLSELSDNQLNLLLESEPDSTDPKLGAVAFSVFQCLDFSVSGSIGPDETTDAVCALVTPEELAPIFPDLGEGEGAQRAELYGFGPSCTFADTDGNEVTIWRVDDVDLEEWRTDASNDDGLNDGTPVPDLGDEAYVGIGTLRFADGTTLISIEAFPGLDVDDDTLIDIARLIAERL